MMSMQEFKRLEERLSTERHPAFRHLLLLPMKALRIECRNVSAHAIDKTSGYDVAYVVAQRHSGSYVLTLFKFLTQSQSQATVWMKIDKLVLPLNKI